MRPRRARGRSPIAYRLSLRPAIGDTRYAIGRALCLLALSLLALAPAAPAQRDTTPARSVRLGEVRDFADVNLSDLLDVTVSIAAAGQTLRLEEAPSIVSVVTHEDIRRMGARTLDQVLRTVPGFDVLSDNLGHKRLLVRGVGGGKYFGFSETVLVLYNGRRLNEHTTGGASFANLEIPLYNVRQVEVIRGPGSALYGTNAFVGVVNIVTFASGSFDGLEVSAAGGSFGTRQVSAVGARSVGPVGLAGSLQVARSDGQRRLVPRDAQSDFDDILGPLVGAPPASLAPGRTREAYRGVDAGANVTVRGLTLDARLHDEHSAGFVGLIDILGTGTDLDNRQLTLTATQRLTLSPRAHLTAEAGLADTRVGYFGNPVPPGFTRPLPGGGTVVLPDGVLIGFGLNSRRADARAQLDLRLGGAHQLALGVGAEREATYDPDTRGNFDIGSAAALPDVVPLSFDVLPHASRRILSAFAQNTWNVVPRVGVTAGVRYDHYDDFGGTVNPRAAVVWRLPHELTLKALYGRAFRAPTFFEEFFNVPSVAAGNPDLRPSVVHTGELALGYRRRGLRLGANAFVSRVLDQIVTSHAVSVENLSIEQQFRNRGALDVRGAEAEASTTVGLDHAVWANATLQRAEDRASGRRAVDIPSVMANAGATVGVLRYVSVSPTVEYRGARPRFRAAAADSSDLRPGDAPGHTLLNLTVRLRNLWETFELGATATNLLDARYVDASPLGGVPGDYPGLGRAVLVKASYKL